MIQELTLQTFKEKIFDFEKNEDWQFKGSLPCIVDFYADWCQPCKIVSPLLEQVAEKFSGHLEVFKVDVDQHGALAGLFGISSIPSLLFVSLENLPRLEVGALPLPAILQIIEEELGIQLEI